MCNKFLVTSSSEYQLAKQCKSSIDLLIQLRPKHHAPERPMLQAANRQTLKTEETVATVAAVWHQEQPQAGGPAQKAVAQPVEMEVKPRRANQGALTA